MNPGLHSARRNRKQPESGKQEKPEPIQLDESTWELIGCLFPQGQHADAARILIGMITGHALLFDFRVRYAVLKLSEGNLQKLREAAEAAQCDPHDVLVWSGLGTVYQRHLDWINAVRSSRAISSGVAPQTGAKGGSAVSPPQHEPVVEVSTPDPVGSLSPQAPFVLPVLPQPAEESSSERASVPTPPSPPARTSEIPDPRPTPPSDYVPAPIDTSDVVIPAEMVELRELLARNMHEVWAWSRMVQGWRYVHSGTTGARSTRIWCRTSD
jgi:hypothetical protein